MNELLNIRHDVDVYKNAADILVMPNKVQEFITGVAEPPSLEPLQLDLDSPSSAWNSHVAALFAHSLLERDQTLEATSGDIAEYFMERCRTLKRTLKSRLPRTEDETEEEVNARRGEEVQASLLQRRIRARQSTVRSASDKVYAADRPSSFMIPADIYAKTKSMLELQTGRLCNSLSQSSALVGKVTMRVMVKTTLCASRNGVILMSMASSALSMHIAEQPMH